MKSLKFKTNIKCMGCVSTVTPHLQQVEGLENWTVDLASPDKVMTADVQSEEVAAAIGKALQNAGYTATEIPS